MYVVAKMEVCVDSVKSAIEAEKGGKLQHLQSFSPIFLSLTIFKSLTIHVNYVQIHVIT